VQSWRRDSSQDRRPGERAGAFPSLPADRPGWRGIVKAEVALPELLNIFCFGESASTARKVLYDRIMGTGRLALADHRP
jgi:hypothetical protein